MKIALKEISVRELAEEYKDNQENGVVGFGGKLDIRPPYQREFVYKEKQRAAVINTIEKGFPLNVMYWAVREHEGFEVIDGQQRTISICQFVDGEFAFNNRYFHNLQKDEKEKILDYKLMVYLCSGTDSEKLDWFRTINIAGEKLTNQELRNAVYSGSWVSNAKRYFSKNGCPAYAIGKDYLTGSPIRQDYLETTISWFSNGQIEEYMGQHQNEPHADALWTYYQNVITWIEKTFTNKRTKFMKGVDWGILYSQFNDEVYDSKEIESEIAKLILDDDVTNKKGIYPYVLTKNEKHLSIRIFSDAIKQKVFEKQKGKCTICGDPFDLSEMEGDHITPWSKGGKTDEANCQMICVEDNRRKSSK